MLLRLAAKLRAVASAPTSQRPKRIYLASTRGKTLSRYRASRRRGGAQGGLAPPGVSLAFSLEFNLSAHSPASHSAARPPPPAPRKDLSRFDAWPSFAHRPQHATPRSPKESISLRPAPRKDLSRFNAQPTFAQRSRPPQHLPRVPRKDPSHFGLHSQASRSAARPPPRGPRKDLSRFDPRPGKDLIA